MVTPQLAPLQSLLAVVTVCGWDDNLSTDQLSCHEECLTASVAIMLCQVACNDDADTIGRARLCTLDCISSSSKFSYFGSGAGADEAELSPPADESQEEVRDAEAEAELAAVVKDDPLAAYDVDVRQEGLAIQEYLMLLQQHQKQ